MQLEPASAPDRFGALPEPGPPAHPPWYQSRPYARPPAVASRPDQWSGEGQGRGLPHLAMVPCRFAEVALCVVVRDGALLRVFLLVKGAGMRLHIPRPYNAQHGVGQSVGTRTDRRADCQHQEGRSRVGHPCQCGTAGHGAPGRTQTSTTRCRHLQKATGVGTRRPQGSQAALRTPVSTAIP